MNLGAQLAVTNTRRATRHSVDFKVVAEHRGSGDLHLHIVNISAQGFLARCTCALGRGERVTIRLPVIGRIEAHLVWARDERTGFQFERIIRSDDFLELVEALQPNPRLRPRR